MKFWRAFANNWPKYVTYGLIEFVQNTAAVAIETDAVAIVTTNSWLSKDGNGLRTSTLPHTTARMLLDRHDNDVADDA